MTKRTKLLALSGALFALLLGAGVLAPLAVDKAFIQSSVEALIRSRTGLDAAVEGSVTLRFLPWPEVELRGLRVGDPDVEREFEELAREARSAAEAEATAARSGSSPFGAAPDGQGEPERARPREAAPPAAPSQERRERFLLRADRLELSPSLLSLLRGRPILRSLKAEGVQLRLAASAGREGEKDLLELLAPVAGADLRLRDSSFVLVRLGKTAEDDQRFTISDASLRAAPLRLDDFFDLDASCLLTIGGLLDAPARLTARGGVFLRPAPEGSSDSGLKALRLTLEKSDAAAPSLSATLDMAPGSGLLRARELRLAPAVGSEISGRVELPLSGRAGARFDLAADDLRAETLSALPWRRLASALASRPAGDGAVFWPAVEGRLGVARLRGFGIEARRTTLELTGAEGSYVARQETFFPGARLQGETRLRLCAGFELASELSATAGGYDPAASARAAEASSPAGLLSARLDLRDAPDGRLGEIVVPAFAPVRFLGALGLAASAAPRQASLSAGLAWTPTAVEARSLRLKADETTVQGSAVWPLDGGPVAVDLSLDQFDFDRWLTGKREKKSPSQGSGPWPRLDLDARLKADKMRAGGVDLRRLASSWIVRGGALAGADASADCFDGSIKAKLTAERGKRPVIDLNLTGAELRALSRRFAGPELARGRCDIRLVFETERPLALGAGVLGPSGGLLLRGRLAASSAKGEIVLPTSSSGRKQGCVYETAELLVEFQPVEKPAADQTPPSLARFLRDHAAQGSFRAGSMAYGRLRTANLRARLDAGNGALMASPVEADFYRGTLAGKVRCDFGPAPRAAVDLKLRDFQAGDLTRDVFGLDYVGGTTRADLSLTLEPEAGLELLRNVNGNIRLAAAEGYLRLNRMLGAQRRGRRQAANGDQVTRYDKATATIPVQNGLARNDDLRVDGPLYNITGEGWADMRQDKLDYLFRLAMTGLPTAPVRVYGPLSSPRHEVQASGVLLDSLSRLGGTILDLPGQVIDLPRKTFDVLRGIFGD